MPSRRERRAEKKNGKARERALPPDAIDHLTALMADASEANSRYLEAAQNVVRGMNLGKPKEGHKWYVDPTRKRVVEQPDAPPPK